MKNRFYYLFILCSVSFLHVSFAQQDQSVLDETLSKLSGSFDANGNFFVRDSSIGAANTPQYDRQLFGAESWLNLNYRNWGFDMGIRFDLFNNSNLLNPQGSFTGQGIGRWYIKKKIKNFGIAAGYLYDQIGSGIIFRAYEERPLAIDNALFGVSLSYDITPDWKVKIFTGRQKQQFDTYNSIMKGLSFEGFITNSSNTFTLAPGFGTVGRTLDDQSVNQLVSEISTYRPEDSIGVKYNAYAFTLYNTLTAGNFTWYIEGAYKTKDVIRDPNAYRVTWAGDLSKGKFVLSDGKVLYSSLSYAAPGLGITGEVKVTDHFTFRVNPFVTLNRGMINYLPVMTRQNTYRLTARYNAATQEIGEQAYQLEVNYSPNKHWSVGLNFSNITRLHASWLPGTGNKDLLYREIYSEIGYKTKKMSILGGVQSQIYNQELYEEKPGKGKLGTITPYAEVLYKFDKSKSIRVEMQYMNTGKGNDAHDGNFGLTNRDFGNWMFGLVEVGIAPHWIFTASDMYNVNPVKTENATHYYTAGLVFSQQANRFSLNYVKQVEGVVCTGGICRFEPAFNGVKMTVNSTF